MTWRFISGLNRVTESTAKELILAQISELNCDNETNEDEESVPPKKKRKSEIVNRLKRIQITEMLIRRFVPSKERN